MHQNEPAARYQLRYLKPPYDLLVVREIVEREGAEMPIRDLSFYSLECAYYRELAT
jgi:hypothetical protein